MSVKHRMGSLLVGLPMIIGTVHATFAAEASNVLAKRIVESIAETSGASQASLPAYAISRQLLVLSRPTSIPNEFESNDSFVKTISEFDAVPLLKDKEVTLGESNISAELQSLDGQIITPLEPASAAENAALKEAKSLLFLQNGLPSPGYKTYLEYESEYLKRIDTLKKETSPELQEQQRAELAILEREWEALGDRSMYAAAVEQFEKSTSVSGTAYADKWVNSIKPVDVIAALRTGLANTNWVRFSRSSAPDNLKVELTDETRGSVLPAIRRLSFDGSIVWFDRPYLLDGFFVSANWKSKTDRPVSVGSGGDSSNSLVPRLIVGVLLAKNVEMQFADDMPSAALGLLQSEQPLSVDGIELSARSAHPIAFQKSSIGLSSPVIVGVVLDELKKIPNPSSDYRWPEN